MSPVNTPKMERLTELLAEQLERQLSAAERAELGRLLKDAPDWRAEDFEVTAAASFVAYDAAAPIAMPAALKSRVKTAVTQRMLNPDGPTQLDNYDSEQTQQGSHSDLQPDLQPGLQLALRPEEPAQVVSLDAKRAEPKEAPRNGLRRLITYGGWLAAAAGVLFAVLVLRDAPQASPSALRSTLIKKPETITIAWANTKDPLSKDAAGDVVWDPVSQRGVMRFSGLPKNDPSKNQYQLWIFDAERDDRHPVDGGVFDVDGDGMVVVPINAKLKVNKPTLFAVTYERPGGVVVSTRERLVALAKVLPKG